MLLTTAQHAVRQRELLDKLGIDAWVERGSQVVSKENYVASFSEIHLNQTHKQDESITPVQAEENDIVSDVAASDSHMSVSVDELNGTHEHKTLSASDNHQKPTQNTIDVVETKTVPNQLENSQHDYTDSHEKTSDDTSSVTAHSQSIKSVSFDLYALHFKSTVILCDASTVKTEKEAVLWQNIQTGLQAHLETLSFPLSDKLATDAESAKASILGWLYRLSSMHMMNASSQLDKRFVLLGQIPEFFPQLEHIHSSANLSEMISQPAEKAEFWHAINQQ